MRAARERGQRVLDQNLTLDIGLPVAHHRTRGAARDRRPYIVLTLEARTGQGDEQFAWIHRARIRRHTAECAVRTEQPPAAALRECRERGIHARDSSTPRATCASLNSRRVVP